eukprot:MONOS_8890.1-p1 / transcript=MONOS_8890.1 / gene=MONOS_8890 / organism=Monocercomonoides_exilis_PA203 / gene_product=unspecified product / transcript_product=unspecified product / location=Mono_scaffold00349:9774-11099(-) / protein_length=421 / sequence_SO=supercontig / SO=protein_coding / is_pseudo=false
MFPEFDFAEEEERLMKEEMNGMLEKMGKERLKPFFSKEEFDENYELILKNKYPFEKALDLLKHVGFENTIKTTGHSIFTDTSLKKRFEKMLIDENEKTEGKDEKLLIDLCECYLLWYAAYRHINEDVLRICEPCLLKNALMKNKREETQKEVEISLLALNKIPVFERLDKELYLKEVKEIIEYHQVHRNLTRLAYQSAWQFLMIRVAYDNDLERVIVRELHCAREVARELEELARCVDWKRKEEEKREKESREAKILNRWLLTMMYFLEHCRLWNEEIVELFNSIVQIFQVAKDDRRDISRKCIDCFRNAEYNRTIEMDILLKCGVIDIIFGETVKCKAEDLQIKCNLNFFKDLCDRLKEKVEEGNGVSRQKDTKRKIYEKEEEEGFEDFVISLHVILPRCTLRRQLHNRICFSDYVVYL